MTDNTQEQEAFFNSTGHQYPTSRILRPAPAQQLEIDHIKRILPGRARRLLDFGCGTGRLTIPFLQMGYDVHGVDISSNSLATLTSLYSSHKTKSWGVLTTSSSVPLKKTYDAVIGSDILHHVDQHTVLPLLARVLNPAGRAVFSEPNAWYLLWYPFIFLRLSWPIEKGILHCSIPSLTAAFRGSGFETPHIEGHGLIPTGLLSKFPVISRVNAWHAGNLPLLRYFAFRLILSATPLS